MSLLAAVKRANRPGPPEHSVGLRLACAGAVITGIVACRSVAELSWTVALVSVVLVAVGMSFSYLTRSQPKGWLKPALALAAMAAFFWFFRQLTGQQLYDVSTVEDPLALLFVWIQVAHAFDVPARRDLAFSLAGSASLMAVAGAQAVDLGFGLYALTWIAFGLWALLGMWGSASDGGRVSVGGLVGTVGGVALLGAAVLVVLPAPRVSGRIDFPANGAGGAGLPSGGGLTGDAGRATEPAKAGSPAGATRVGGFLGFATHLDTALRGSLGDTVVMRVRAQRPSYWIGETFDTWNGRSWVTPTRNVPIPLFSGSPFPVPPSVDSPVAISPQTAQGDLQTFYLAQSSPNLIFHADVPSEVWFPARTIYVSGHDTLVSPIALGPGAIYTVRSTVNAATPAELGAVAGPASAGASPAQIRALRADLVLPHPYPRVRALAERITAGRHGTEAKIEAIIAWMGSHTHYSTDIPPLPPGADTVDEFLFGNRTGFCEQISTAMAVMLRSLGIPAREAVGYVPGPYDPITDLYEVQAKDAHAWVQVWFPRYGWQSFDPTAVVPLANPSPGITLLHDAGRTVEKIPPVPTGVVLGLALLAGLVLRWRRRRPPTWEIALARRLERAGARVGRHRGPGETLTEYASALDALDASGGEGDGTLDPHGDGPHGDGPRAALARLAEASAYGGHEPTADQRLAAARSRRLVRVDAGRARSAATVGTRSLTPAPWPGPRPGWPPSPGGGAGASADGDG